MKCAEAREPGCDNESVSPTPDQQARAEAIAAEITARLAGPPSPCPAPSPTGRPTAATPAAAATPTPRNSTAPTANGPARKTARPPPRSSTDDQPADYAPWFDNHKRIRELLAELEELSLDIAENDPRWNR